MSTKDKSTTPTQHREGQESNRQRTDVRIQPTNEFLAYLPKAYIDTQGNVPQSKVWNTLMQQRESQVEQFTTPVRQWCGGTMYQRANGTYVKPYLPPMVWNICPIRDNRKDDAVYISSYKKRAERLALTKFCECKVKKIRMQHHPCIGLSETQCKACNVEGWTSPEGGKATFYFYNETPRTNMSYNGIRVFTNPYLKRMMEIRRSGGTGQPFTEWTRPTWGRNTFPYVEETTTTQPTKRAGPAPKDKNPAPKTHTIPMVNRSNFQCRCKEPKWVRMWVNKSVGKGRCWQQPHNSCQGCKIKLAVMAKPDDIIIKTIKHDDDERTMAKNRDQLKDEIKRLGVNQVRSGVLAELKRHAEPAVKVKRAEIEKVSGTINYPWQELGSDGKLSRSYVKRPFKKVNETDFLHEIASPDTYLIAIYKGNAFVSSADGKRLSTYPATYDDIPKRMTHPTKEAGFRKAGVAEDRAMDQAPAHGSTNMKQRLNKVRKHKVPLAPLVLPANKSSTPPMTDDEPQPDSPLTKSMIYELKRGFNFKDNGTLAAKCLRALPPAQDSLVVALMDQSPSQFHKMMAGKPTTEEDREIKREITNLTYAQALGIRAAANMARNLKEEPKISLLQRLRCPECNCRATRRYTYVNPPREVIECFRCEATTTISNG